MSHVPNELAEVFPHAVERMHELKQTDAHFARLFDGYHELNREIHRIETDITPASDEVTEALKKKRLSLLDQIRDMLA